MGFLNKLTGYKKHLSKSDLHEVLATLYTGNSVKKKKAMEILLRETQDILSRYQMNPTLDYLDALCKVYLVSNEQDKILNAFNYSISNKYFRLDDTILIELIKYFSPVHSKKELQILTPKILLIGGTKTYPVVREFFRSNFSLIMDNLTNGDSDAQYLSIKTLGWFINHLGSPDGFDKILIPYLQSKEDRIVIAVLQTFSPAKTKEQFDAIFPILCSLLNHPNIKVRKAIFSFLDLNNVAIRGQEINKFVSFEWWDEVIRSGKESIPFLLLAIKDQDSKVRAKAIDTLSQIARKLDHNDSSYEEAIQLLLSLLNDGNSEDYQSALIGLRLVNDQRYPTK